MCINVLSIVSRGGQVMSVYEEYADADEDGQLVLFEFIELIRQLRIWACTNLGFQKEQRCRGIFPDSFSVAVVEVVLFGCCLGGPLQ